jgi:flagellar protein FliL
MSKDDSKKNEKAKSGGTMKIVLIVLGAVITMGAGVGGGLYFAGTLTSHGPKEDPNRPKLVVRSDEPAEATEAEPGKAPPLKEGTVSVKDDKAKIDPKKYEVTYFPIEQNLTANLADSQGFVQVGLSLSTYYDGKVISNIQRQMVPIRSAILMVLSEQDGTVLATPEGKKLLQEELTKAINRVLREKEGFGGIDNVYFTTLVVQ